MVDLNGVGGYKPIPKGKVPVPSDSEKEAAKKATADTLRSAGTKATAALFLRSGAFRINILITGGSATVSAIGSGIDEHGNPVSGKDLADKVQSNLNGANFQKGSEGRYLWGIQVNPRG